MKSIIRKKRVGYTPTKEELDYLFNDVWIVAQALKLQLDEGLNKMTIGSDALFDYKTRVGKNFNKWFPEIYDKKGIVFDLLHDFYRGGFTYVNPRYQGVDIKCGCTYDCNSMYPSVMKNELLPYGEAIGFSGKYNENFSDIYPLYLQTIVVEFKLKEGHIPFATDKTGFVKKEY